MDNFGRKAESFSTKTIHSSLFTIHLPYGGVAQLGEHLPCKQGVMGSNPIISTKVGNHWFSGNRTTQNMGL